MNNDAGKGDSYRPVNKKVYDENYDRIFRSGNKTKKEDSLTQNKIDEMDRIENEREFHDQRFN